LVICLYSSFFLVKCLAEIVNSTDNHFYLGSVKQTGPNELLLAADLDISVSTIQKWKNIVNNNWWETSQMCCCQYA